MIHGTCSGLIYQTMDTKMKRQIGAIVTGLLFFCLCLSSFAFAQGQIRKLTIFSNNLGLVEGKKMITLKKGINEGVTFGPVSKGIILDSIYAKAEKCEFLEQKYSSDSLLSWKVDSQKEGEALLRVVYLTSGLNWKLNYILEVNKENTFMKLYGWATVENLTGIDFSQTSLILTPQLPLSVEESIFPGNLLKSSSLASSSFLPDIFYSIPYPMTFKNEEKKRILLFSRDNVSITKIYLFDGEKYGEEVREELWFTNEEEKGLGIFLPQGLAYIYGIDSDERITFIGESPFPGVSPEEEGRIYLGGAKNIEGERVLISMNPPESYEDEDGHKIILNEYSYKIILYNRRQTPTTVEVVEHFYEKLESLKSDPSPYMQGKDFAIYQVEVPSQEKKEIEYTARTKSKGVIK